MSEQNRWLLRSCIAAALGGGYLPIAGAEEPLEEVVVTGSHIAGAALDFALPVSVTDDEELRRQGSPTPLELIRSIPASQATFGEANAQQVFQGSGGVSVNLRGLDGGRTLVLFNGRRLPISPVPLLGVDVNLLPAGAIGRVEVLKEGASSTYGADAIAGVVNFRSKRGFDGLSLDASFTGIEDTDGDYSADISWGRKSESWDVLFAAGYRHRSELEVVDRDFSFRDFSPSAGLGGISATGGPGAFVIPNLPPPPGFAFNAFADPACQQLGQILVNAAPAPMCQFRFAAFQNLVEREETYSAYAEYNQKLGDFAELHVDALYAAHDTPEENVSPSFPMLQGPGTSVSQRFGLPADPSNSPLFLIPVGNPGLQALLPALTAQQAAAIQQLGGVFGNGLLFRTLGVGGNPLFGNEGIERSRLFDALRLSTGLTGELGGVSWDLALTYGENLNHIRSPLQLPARVQLALAGFGGFDCTGTTPGANGCLYLNPFSTGIAGNVKTGEINPDFSAGGTFVPATVNSREVVDYVFGLLDSEESTEVLVADLLFSGKSGLTLAGGDVRWAAGAQFREDRYRRSLSDESNLAITPCADSVLNPNATCTVATGPYDSQTGFREVDINDDVIGAFAEVSLPITADLHAQLAFRYEDYGGRAGSTSNPKLALRYSPADWLTLRGSAGSTFRGPVLTQAAQNDVITSLQFVPLFGTVRAFDNTSNPNLRPEEADNYGVGAVIETSDFSLSLDWYRIDLHDKIVNENGPDVVTAFFGSPGAVMNNCGRPGLEALQARFTFVGGVCAPANLLRTRANFINGPDEQVSGIDLSGRYAVAEAWGGRVQLGIDATYTLEYERDEFFIEGVRVPTAGGRDFAGTRNGFSPLPELRGSVFAEYSRSLHDLRITGRFVDGMTNLNPAARNADGSPDDIASHFAVDLVYRLRMPGKLTASVAAINVADRDPPFVKFLDFGYDPFLFGPAGRAFKVILSKSF